MALTDADKNYLEKTFEKSFERSFERSAKTFATKEELSKTNDSVRRLELMMEHGFDELRGILGDILDWVKEVPAQRQRLDDHDLQIRQLNRTVYGYDSNLE